MPVESANDFLPQTQNLEDTFAVVNARHFRIGKTAGEVRRPERFQQVATAMGDYFTAGVAYLANRGHDAIMQELGTVTWWMVNRKRVLTALVDDMSRAAISLGVPPQVALRTYHQNDEPHVLTLGEQRGAQLVTLDVVLMPPEFAVRAQTSPIEALATMTWIASQVRDLANERLTVDPAAVDIRAEAAEAHFLRHARSLFPDLVLGPTYLRALADYPDGIASLPAGSWYRGQPPEAFLHPEHN